jgi:hypothetical protein
VVDESDGASGNGRARRAQGIQSGRKMNPNTHKNKHTGHKKQKQTNLKLKQTNKKDSVLPTVTNKQPKCEAKTTRQIMSVKHTDRTCHTAFFCQRESPE